MDNLQTAIMINIVKQAKREDWLMNLNAKEAEEKITAVLLKRNIDDKKFASKIYLEIVLSNITIE